MRELMRQAQRIRDEAGRAYRAARMGLTRREIERETDDEIRAAVRAMMTAAADGEVN